MFRILHCSDLHLEASFANGGLPATVGAWRRADLNATLGRILSLARERKVDVVTIAGDLYEQEYALPDTIDFLVQQFAKLAPIRVFIAPGEHDPYTSDSLYALTCWPENVVIFSEGRLTAAKLTPGIHLWGAAYPPERGHKTLDKFRAPRAGVNLLLLHAADAEQRASGDRELFRVDAAAVRTAGFDFALLGHQHSGHLWPEDAPCCVYPGSPEPLTSEETNVAHQVVLLTIQDGICTPKPIPISQWRYRSLRVDLTGCESTDEAVRHVKQLLQTDSGGDDERSICHITLIGRPEFDLDLEALVGEVETKAHVRYEARPSLPYDLEQLAQEQTVRGLLVRRFQARFEAARSLHERALAESALFCALRALDGKQVGLDEVH